MTIKFLRPIVVTLLISLCSTPIAVADAPKDASAGGPPPQGLTPMQPVMAQPMPQTAPGIPGVPPAYYPQPGAPGYPGAYPPGYPQPMPGAYMGQPYPGAIPGGYPYTMQPGYAPPSGQQGQVSQHEAPARDATPSGPTPYELQEAAIQRGRMQAQAEMDMFNNSKPPDPMPDPNISADYQTEGTKGAKLKSAASKVGRGIGRTVGVAAPLVGGLFLTKAIMNMGNSTGVRLVPTGGMGMPMGGMGMPMGGFGMPMMGGMGMPGMYGP
ncbi:MAG TPA: hypothetical protein V6D17_20545 [Candidatus Obscuribacterales bacterium]